jgi:hypothetical protein
MKKLYIVTLLLFFPVGLSANTSDEVRKEWVYVNLIDDITMCSSFYFISYENLTNAKVEEANQFLEITKILMDRARHVGKQIDLKDKAIDNKFKKHLKIQVEMIDSKAKNISILTDEFGEKCRIWIEGNFENRVDFWANEWSKRFED